MQDQNPNKPEHKQIERYVEMDLGGTFVSLPAGHCFKRLRLIIVALSTYFDSSVTDFRFHGESSMGFYVVFNMPVTHEPFLQPDGVPTL